MLRNQPRWHDAANGPLLGEARLLWRAKRTTPPPTSPDPEEEGEEEAAGENQAATSTESGNQAHNKSIDTQREVAHRRAINTLLGETPVSGEDLHARNIASDAIALREQLQTSIERLQEASNKAAGHPDETEFRREITELQITVGALKKRMTDFVHPLMGDGEQHPGMELDRWESGKMTPAEFLLKYEAYMGDGGEMDTIDLADQGLSDAERAERKAGRMQLLADTRAAVEQAKETIPQNLSQQAVRAVSDVSEKELWMNIYNDDERTLIIRSISEAAGLSTLKEIITDDISTIKQVYTERDVDGLIQKIERTALEHRRDSSMTTHTHAELTGGGYVDPKNILSIMMAKGNEMNALLGIEWMTAYEYFDAFKEVLEGIKELRKQKSRLRVSRAASTIGKALSMIPGMGGEALVSLLDQQQEAKNEEITSGFLKELKNNRIDYGFSNLFGDGKGDPGLLSYYRQIGDTNRTRAILEFAAGKAMLYGMSGKSWKEYVLPGNIPFRSLMPTEWTEPQIESWFSNLGFSNKQGEDSQIKAGETYANGRSKFDDYVIPFKGAVNGMSLWFAKGIANVALKKVKEGQMSTTLTLIVCDAWENNPLFRKYAWQEKDWWDRLAGDNKQLLIGMTKYDQKHLIRGLEVGETNIAKADEKFDKSPELRGKQRIGPLIAAARSYLLKLDPTLENTDEKTQIRFFGLQAKLLACKQIGPEDGLPKGKYGTFYHPDLVPYHIKYDPNEMRDAAVNALGDDVFIERTEIINCSAEVMQYIGTLRENGFAEPTKARYFFSQIITAHEELKNLANKPGPQQKDFRQALENFRKKQRGNLDLWINRALQQNGASVLLTEKHADQGPRLLVATLLAEGLISIEAIEKLDQAKNKHAKTLIKQYKAIKGTASRRDRGTPPSATTSVASTAA